MHHARNGFLIAKGLEEAAQREDAFGYRLAVEVPIGYLDKSVSVSALIEPSEPIFVDDLLEDQYRRFLNGS